MEGMAVIGLIRVRNVSKYIRHTLDHAATYCQRIYVYDDCSTDDTVEVMLRHPVVHKIIKGRRHDDNRGRAEWQNRQAVLELAQAHATPADWLVYLDADEFIEFDFKRLDKLPDSTVAVRMQLYDYYITAQDVNSHFLQRQYLGPEYRRIVMAFRNHPALRYESNDQREVHLHQPKVTVLNAGYVRHYGKAISVEAWEEKCRYYMTFKKYAAKWARRRGKAVHTTSSFNMPLITWPERKKKGVLLTREIEKNSIY